MNIEHRTLNVQHRIMYSVDLKKTEQHATQALALRERSYPSKFCGSLVLKSIKRCVINIGRSMFNVQSVHCSGQAEFHIR